MKYLIVGAGGTGGAIAAYLAKAGKDVAVIARGEHLNAITQKGLTLKPRGGREYTVTMPAFTMEDYREKPDIIFLCVKGYSLDDALIAFLKRACHQDTIIIPILNIYGTGGSLQPSFPDNLVTDGCIYIASFIESPGVIAMERDIFTVVFGVRNPAEETPVLDNVKQDLEDAGITAEHSKHIQRDTFIKFSYISPSNACGVYYNVPAGAIQQNGEIRDIFIELVKELVRLGQAMGITFEEDIVKRNLAMVDSLPPDMLTSMQKDIAEGKPSEIDGLIFEVIRMAEKYGVSLPKYEEIIAAFYSEKR